MAKTQAQLRVELVQQGKYKRTLALLDKAIQKQSYLHRERAHLHLYMGHTQQARSDLDVTGRLEAQPFHTPPGRLHSDSPHNAIGVTYWMEGHRELAQAFWRNTTSLLCANRVGYSHMGGGIEAGLLLWFGAVHTRQKSDIDLVRTFYEKRLASTFWSHSLKSWPGPIVRFFLNQIDEQSLINSASGCHRQLCEACFAAAVRARESGRHAAYKKLMKMAAAGKGPSDLYDFYNVFPFYLARHEASA